MNEGTFFRSRYQKGDGGRGGGRGGAREVSTFREKVLTVLPRNSTELIVVSVDFDQVFHQGNINNKKPSNRTSKCSDHYFKWGRN